MMTNIPRMTLMGIARSRIPSSRMVDGWNLMKPMPTAAK